jgi:predicted SAM-dependent methyltransferase
LEAQVIGLNVGSGQRPFTSTPEVRWINIDSQERWNPDRVCDGTKVSLPDNYADYVVLHHVLEHFGCGEGWALIYEAHRLLKPGGSLLVFVPNLRALAQRWLAGGLTTQIYVTNLYGAYMGSEDDRHKWGFDEDSLREFLSQLLWKVKPFDWRPIPGADIAKDFWILGAECVK